MKSTRNYLWVFILFLFITFGFFYKSLFYGQIPFPGDLLIGEYAPYNSYPFLGYAPAGYPNKGQDFDVLRLLYPEKEFSIRTFKNFEFPLWNPYNFSGNPHIGSLQSGSFYPLNILFILLPFVFAWTSFIIVQPILTGIFSFLFARELNVSVKSSIFASFIFAFSSYSIVWMEYGNIGHSIVWMPFAMWMILKNLKEPSVSKSIAISLSLTFVILAGYIQTSFYVFVFLLGFIIFYIFFMDRKNKIRNISIFCLIFILPILLSAIQLLPTLELLFQSARAPYSKEVFLKLLIPPFHFITMFVPDFFGNPATRNYWLNGTYIERVAYIGVVPLIFMFYSFFKKQNSTFWFFAASAIIVLFLTFDTFIARILYFFQMPLISTAVPTRIMFVFCFSVSILSGFGLDAFLKDHNKKLFLKVVGILGGVYFLSWTFVSIAPALFKELSWISNLQISKRNLILPSGIFLVSAFTLLVSFYIGKYKKFIIIFLFVFAVLDLFYFFQKITPFAPKETVYPSTEVLQQLKKIQGINRSWGYGSGYVSANLQTYEKIFSPDGYNALHIKRYGELLTSSENGKIAVSIPRSDPMIAPGFGESNLRENKYRQRLLNLLGVKYILIKNESLGQNYSPDYKTFPKEIYNLVWQKNVWQIYENINTLPRVFLAGSFVVEDDKDKAIQMIFDENLDLREKIILEENISQIMTIAKDEKARVKVEKYSPNEVIVKTDARTNMILFISDNYYSGWKVKIDKKSGKIYRANYSFRAVPVPKGQHEITFAYYPESFSLGLKISLITVTLLGIFIFVKRFIKANV